MWWAPAGPASCLGLQRVHRASQLGVHHGASASLRIARARHWPPTPDPATDKPNLAGHAALAETSVLGMITARAWRACFNQLGWQSALLISDDRSCFQVSDRASTVDAAAVSSLWVISLGVLHSGLLLLQPKASERINVLVVVFPAGSMPRQEVGFLPPPRPALPPLRRKQP